MEPARETTDTPKGARNTSGGWGQDLQWRAVRPRIKLPKETWRKQDGIRNTRRSWGQILLARICNTSDNWGQTCNTSDNWGQCVTLRCYGICNTSDNWGQILVKMLTGTRAEPCDDLNTSRGWGRVHQALPVTPPGTEQRGTATRQ